MKSHLQLIPTVEMTREDWLAYRHTGIGASDVGCILGLDDYTSSLELWHYKTGAARKFDVETMSMFMGQQQEDLIAQMWQYWDGDEESMINNFRQGRIIRKCQRVNAYVRNPNYPWLFVSLDRKINKVEPAGEGTLELKTISGYEADKWAAGLPPKYVTQVQTQMLVCEFVWGEMAVLRDGRRLDVMPFERSEAIMEHIVTKTKKFWDSVEAGRKLVNIQYDARINFNQRLVNECQAELDNLAPEPDGSLAYEAYLSEKFNRPRLTDRRGTEQELLWAQEQARLKQQLEEIATEKRRYEEKIKVAMADYQVLDFGVNGKVYWSVDSAGKRVFRNRLK